MQIVYDAVFGIIAILTFKIWALEKLKPEIKTFHSYKYNKSKELSWFKYCHDT